MSGKSMVWQVLLLLLILPLSLLAQNQDRSRRNIVRHSLSGTITDASTGSPLPGATIYIPDLRMGTTSGNNGSFIFRNISPGGHLIEISFVGYGTFTEHIYINGDVKKDVSLSPSIIENNEVVVTGVSTATQLRRSAAPVSIIKRSTLLKGVSANLVEALSRVPGVTALSSSPAVAKPFIRGLGYNRVVVINDGVRQEGQQWGDEHGLEIDEFTVNKVEVLKGPASLMYGSDAMAGVINILSNVPVQEGFIKVNILGNYQTNNRLRATSANIAGNSNGLYWNLSGTYKAAADYGNRFDGRVYNSKFKEKNLGGYIGYTGNWGYSQISISSFNQTPGMIEGERAESGAFLKPLPGGGETIPSKDDFNDVEAHVPFQDINHFKIGSDNNIKIGGGRLNLILAHQINTRKEFGNIDDPSEAELYFDLQSTTYNVSYHLKEKNNWRTSIGVSGMFQSNSNKGEEVLIPEYNMFDIGGFLYSRKNYQNLSVSGGIRYDVRRVNSKSFVSGNEYVFEDFSKTFSNVSGSIGLSYLVSKQVTLKANIAKGFRSPNMPELASNGTHEGTNRYEYGEKELKPETSLQFDAGFEFNSEHISLTANVFRNNIDDFIFYRKLQNASGGDSTVEVDGEFIPAFKFDQRKANLTGLEITMDLHPHPLDWLHFENSFSWVRGRFTDKIGGSSNLPLIPAPRVLSELRGDFFEKGKWIRNLSIKLELDHNFKQDKAFTAYDTETSTSSYTLINTGVSADFVRKNKTLFSIYMNLINVGDVAYQNHLSRLKYTSINPVTGRMGVFNMGRNFSVKVYVPLEFEL